MTICCLKSTSVSFEIVAQTDQAKQNIFSKRNTAKSKESCGKGIEWRVRLCDLIQLACVRLRLVVYFKKKNAHMWMNHVSLFLLQWFSFIWICFSVMQFVHWNKSAPNYGWYGFVFSSHWRFQLFQRSNNCIIHPLFIVFKQILSTFRIR